MIIILEIDFNWCHSFYFGSENKKKILGNGAEFEAALISIALLDLISDHSSDHVWTSS